MSVMELAGSVIEPPAGLHNLDAERSLLGTVMFENEAYHRVEGIVRPEHFFEPTHARIFAMAGRLLAKQTLADPISIAEKLVGDEGLIELGATRYLAQLVEHAPPAPAAPTYAAIVADLAHRRALVRIADEAAEEVMQRDIPARDLIEATEQKLFSLAERGNMGGGFITFETALTKSLEATAAAYGRDGGLSGLSTGLLDLDQKLGGLHPSDLIILAARPSMGKTALATNIAFHVARHFAYDNPPNGTKRTTSGGVVGFFSLEMSEEQLAARVLAEVSGVSSDAMRRGTIKAHEYGQVRDAAMEIMASPLHIDATGALSIGKLAARARRLKRTSGLDLIVVDYLQLATADRNRNDGRVQEVTEITTGLKALAKELQVPVLALSQLSRKVEEREDKRPQLSDLRESGSIEQDADVVMFIYREAYYLSRTEPKEETPEHLTWTEEMDRCRGQADVIIGKQRHGPIGTVRLSFNEDLTKFGNLAREGRYGVDFSEPRGGRD